MFSLINLFTPFAGFKLSKLPATRHPRLEPIPPGKFPPPRFAPAYFPEEALWRVVETHSSIDGTLRRFIPHEYREARAAQDACTRFNKLFANQNPG